MRKRIGAALAAIAAVLVAAEAVHGAAPHEEGSHGMVAIPGAEALTWQAGPPSLPKGIRISLLAGDPDKPGPFVLRLTIPAGTVIAPHTHATAESVTILSGSLFHAMGRTLDKAGGKKLSAGGFVFLPADMPHSLWSTDEPVLLQVNGTGPFGLNYVDPADDPSRKG